MVRSLLSMEKLYTRQFITTYYVMSWCNWILQELRFLTTAFVGFAFGQLLKDIPQEKVNGLIEFTGLSDDKRDMIQRVMNRAYKWYFDEQNQA
jgi:hypothetical protein